MKNYYLLSIIFFCILNGLISQTQVILKLNEKEYFEIPGLNVMVFQDFYPEGHQSGVGIIQNGVRVATNGDLRLDPTPGQWSPIPKLIKRTVNKANNEISVNLVFPDSARDKKGFNPINYPDLYFNYTVNVRSQEKSVIITVDLDRKLPDEWYNKVSFNLELYPTDLFGKSWILDSKSGIFPHQANGPVAIGINIEFQPIPYATGKKLSIAPESDQQRMTIESKYTNLELIDGRSQHNNGWFVVKSLVAKGSTKNAIEWIVSPNVIPGFLYAPVIHVSQVGYYPKQKKVAVIETDINDNSIKDAELFKISPDGQHMKVLTRKPQKWGIFLRYNYLQFDFSQVNTSGSYFIQYGKSKTLPFKIDKDVFDRGVWQPTIEYFLPIQMCHMRVTENYKVWHGLCHMDDALMAPVNRNHFDGYSQGDSTLTKYKPFEHVPGLNIGGWHDAGDDDLRIESQAGEVNILSLMYENFKPMEDNTSVDQINRLTEIHRPDGKPDILQQIEHGALTVLAGNKNLGRLYRGIISPTLQQYVMMGDVSNQTDNKINTIGTIFNLNDSLIKTDDRLVFTEKNNWHELKTAADLAAASRVLKGFNDTLSDQCLKTAVALWLSPRELQKYESVIKVQTAVELYITTGEETYKQYILQNKNAIVKTIRETGWIVGRVLPKLNDKTFTDEVNKAVLVYMEDFRKIEKENPFGIPYKPKIWGAGWEIQGMGVKQYFMHTSFPGIVPADYMLNALNFVLGCHPGENTSSFASGVGARSATVAYGYNRADWGYIPGGVVSGTALIRPDFPELKEFPYLWQQTEYVLGGGATNFVFMVLAAQKLMKE